MKSPPRSQESAAAIAEPPEQEARYAALLATSPDAIIAIDRDGTITDWNPAAEQIFGYTRPLAVGRRAVELIGPDSAGKPHPAELALNLKTGKGRLLGKRTEMIATRANGWKFPAELLLTRASDHGQPLFVACLRDLTERKRAESVLLRSEERFRMLVEGVEDYAIHLLDPSGRVLTWNAGVERIEGYRARDIIGRRFNRFYTPEDIARAKPAQVLATAAADGRQRQEGWSVRKDGSRYWASVVLTALRHEDGTLFGYSRIARDLTGRKDAAAAAEKLTAELEGQLRERATELQTAARRLRELEAR